MAIFEARVKHVENKASKSTDAENYTNHATKTRFRIASVTHCREVRVLVNRKQHSSVRRLVNDQRLFLFVPHRRPYCG